MTDRRPTDAKPEGPNQERTLTPAAQRALEEAAARRAKQGDTGPAAKEVGGREGPDPARYGDWEKGGIVSDF